MRASRTLVISSSVGDEYAFEDIGSVAAQPYRKAGALASVSEVANSDEQLQKGGHNLSLSFTKSGQVNLYSLICLQLSEESALREMGKIPFATNSPYTVLIKGGSQTLTTGPAHGFKQQLSNSPNTL